MEDDKVEYFLSTSTINVIANEIEYALTDREKYELTLELIKRQDNTYTAQIEEYIQQLRKQ